MTTDILKERQAWTLAQKVDHALATIDVFISRMGGIDKVYCSFSGGKDSTVLLHLCRVLYPDILAVFCSTGNEYPEIIQFVREQAKYTSHKAGDYTAPSLGEIRLSSCRKRNRTKGSQSKIQPEHRNRVYHYGNRLFLSG